VRRLAVLSLHSSPLAQPGTADAGGMNVYVRELAAALARSGVHCDVYTRAVSPTTPAIVSVEPNFDVHHLPAGPIAPVPKHELAGLVPEFTDAVLGRIRSDRPTDLIHANYWLSGMTGHALKHELDLPLVSTFHTLDRVKAEADASERETAQRAEAEAAIIGCSDAILASCDDERAQLERLYGADRQRIEIVSPGVDHAFFAPGDRNQARRALGLPEDGEMLVFVGRIQPLKGLDVAIGALASVRDERRTAFLVVVGGPSGPEGHSELVRAHELADQLGLGRHVYFIPPQPHELLGTYYRAANVCLVPSRSESFGLVALEAAACGTPVVASAVGGLNTLVETGRTGFLVEGRDPAPYAEGVLAILRSPGLAAEMSAAAAAGARKYTWRTAADGLVALYADLTSRELVDCV
jgi:D-inositol-3-phosphate glycosyltransferase